MNIALYAQVYPYHMLARSEFPREEWICVLALQRIVSGTIMVKMGPSSSRVPDNVVLRFVNMNTDKLGSQL